MIFNCLINSSILLKESDHPMIEKNAEMKPSHPKRTVPVCKLKQKNPSSTNGDDDEGIFNQR